MRCFGCCDEDGVWQPRDPCNQFGDWKHAHRWHCGSWAGTVGGRSPRQRGQERLLWQGFEVLTIETLHAAWGLCPGPAGCEYAFLLDTECHAVRQKRHYRPNTLVRPHSSAVTWGHKRPGYVIKLAAPLTLFRVGGFFLSGSNNAAGKKGWMAINAPASP